MRRKLIFFSLSMFFLVFLFACNKPKDKIDDDKLDNKPKEEVVLKRTNLSYSLANQLPGSYDNYLSEYHYESKNLPFTVIKNELSYKNTLASNEFKQNLIEADVVLLEILNVYNKVVNELKFYSDKTIDTKNLTLPLNINLKNVTYNGFMIMTEIDIDISGDAKDLKLNYYNIEGNFTLNITKVIKKSNEIEVKINLNLENAKYQYNNLNGFTFHIIEGKEIELSIVANENNCLKVNNYLIEKFTNKFVKVFITNKIFDTSNELNKQQNNAFYFYGNDKIGAILNDINEIYFYNKKDKEITYSKQIKDLEVFDNAQGMLYKSMVGNIQNEKVAFAGYTLNAISGWKDAFINENYIKLNFDDSSSYTQEQLKQTQLQFGSYNGMVEANASIGFQNLQTNIYSNDQQNILGYFITSDAFNSDIYKYLVSIDDESLIKIKVDETKKADIDYLLLYIYRMKLECDGIEFDYSSIPTIIELNKNQYFNNLGINLQLGYDKYQTYVINVLSENEVIDFYRIDGLSVNITNIYYKDDLFIAYGQKERKPYIFTFKLDNQKHINKSEIKEYQYRRYGLMTDVIFDKTKEQLVGTISLSTGHTDTIYLDYKYLMLPKVVHHIQYNHSHDIKIKPEYIVIHETANISTGADGLMHYLYWNRDPNANASTHFVVDDTTVWQLLELDERAWHVGDNNGYSKITNYNSIGIEICVNEDGDYMAARQKTIQLTILLLQELNLTPDKVVRHKDASGKYCPKYMLDKPELWDDFLDQVTNGYNELIK